MKKIISTLACTAMLATSALADFARVELGVGAWAQTPSGGMTYSDSGATGTYASEKKVNNNGYAWLLVKHPIPVLPNIRLEHSCVKDTGLVTGTFKNFSATGQAGSIEIKQYDIVPYYNILDNTFWMTVDLGLDIKVLQTNIKADGVTVDSIPNTNYDDTISLTLPLAYLRARVQIPGTDIGFELDGKYVTYDGSTIYDARAKVDYTLDFVPVVQPAIEVGYRVQKFDLKTDDDKTKMNIDFSGVYAGIMLRF
jgi:outer membrane protein